MTDQPIPPEAYEPPPPPDPAVIKKQQDTKLILKIVIVLFLIRLVFFTLDFIFKPKVKDDRFKYTPIVVNQQKSKDIISVVGVMRTSGLTDDEKQKNNLQIILYQITDFGDKSAKQTPGYYLQGDGPTLERNVGKCARISGTIPTTWKNKTDLLYGRSYIVVSDIKPLDFSNCNTYVEDKNNESLPTATFEGSLERTIRPAPDIAYDYLLNLDKPVISSDSASGLPQEIKQITLVPKNDELWQRFENEVNKNIIIHGFEKWGYAESKYVLVTSIDETKDTMDLTNQTYFVDTTGWQLIENKDCNFTFKKPDFFEITTATSSATSNYTPNISGFFSPKTDINWLNLNAGCFYNNEQLPLKQLITKSMNTVEYINSTTIQDKQGFMKLENQSDGTKHETYYVKLGDGRIFNFELYYPPSSSYVSAARTILATVSFK